MQNKRFWNCSLTKPYVISKQQETKTNITTKKNTQEMLAI